uniref:Uncharacterized protein n=1 Tax=Euplotes vannus TaxID=5939 RepID=Q6A1P8_EUPVA|nr:hypothetical protein [Euplotes vannus]
MDAACFKCQRTSSGALFLTSLFLDRVSAENTQPLKAKYRSSPGLPTLRKFVLGTCRCLFTILWDCLEVAGLNLVSLAESDRTSDKLESRVLDFEVFLLSFLPFFLVERLLLEGSKELYLCDGVEVWPSKGINLEKLYSFRFLTYCGASVWFLSISVQCFGFTMLWSVKIGMFTRLCML